METPDKGIAKIENPIRILRIFKKIASSKLVVYIRSADDPKILIRGVATKIIEHERNKSLVIVGLSDRAVSYLAGKTSIKIEFVLMERKIVASCDLKDLTKDQLHLILPKKLISIERRKDQRFAPKENLPLFADFKSLLDPANFYINSPVFFPYQSCFGYIRIQDISQGGMCLVTSFPCFKDIFVPEYQNHNFNILFPLKQPVEMALKVIWQKRIKDYKNNSTYELTYKYGCQFIDPTEYFRQHLYLYTKELANVSAI